VETQTAQDAQIRVDGYPSGSWITSASNEVQDVITGVTLNLKSADPGNPITVTIANDHDAVKDKIQEFVDAYNEAVGQVNTETKYDEETEESGPLFGNASAIGIKTSLQSIVAAAIPGIDSTALYQSLAEVGVKLGSSGMLSIDDDKLDDALETNFTAVGEVFAFNSTTTDNNLDYFYRTEATQGGTYTVVANYDASGNLTSATINGHEATIEDNYIIGADGQPEEGLRIEFTYPGGGAGSITADITLSTGAAVQISNKIEYITDPIDGTIQNAEDGINDAIESLDRQIERWEDRLDMIEEQLQQQFLNMEIAINQLQSTGNYLSAMLSNL
jgi:flagellar hook-associated protein 2